MGELACKLARECVFGEEVMGQSSVLGHRGRKALPVEGVNLIKSTILQHKYPAMMMESETYKSIWKCCTDALNHACSKIRRQKKIE